MPRSLPRWIALALLLAAPAVERAAVTASPRVRPGDCAACHAKDRKLPAGHVDTRALSFDDCAKCHGQPAAEGQSAAPALSGKLPAGHLHRLRGVSCADCHGKGKARAFPAAATCLGCHGPAADLVTKTAAVKPENPHASPHWGPTMECTVCHRQHQPTVNWCAHCHTFEFKVP